MATSAAESGAGVPEIQIGCLYYYTDRDGAEKPVKVLSIDRSLEPPSYTILIDGASRETEADRLRIRPAADSTDGGSPATRIAIPDSFRCPISGALMEDPVVDPEGNTFDRAGIVHWLTRNSTSPITRSRLTVDMLKPNRALADSIATFKPLLESEDDGTAKMQHPEVKRAFEEEEAFRDSSMWIGRVRLQVLRATALPKSDAIVVISNGSSHMLKIPEKPEDSSFKKATPSVAGKDPVWNHDVTFPVAARVGQDDGRGLLFNVKQLAVGKQWTGKNEGEWLGKVTLDLGPLIARGGQAEELALPILKKGLPVGEAKLHLVVSCESNAYEAFAEQVAQETANAPDRTAPQQKEDVMTLLTAGMNAANCIKSGQLWRDPKTGMRAGQDLGKALRGVVGGPDVNGEGWSTEQLFTDEQMAEQRRVYDDAFDRGGVVCARDALRVLMDQQRLHNQEAAAARRSGN